MLGADDETLPREGEPRLKSVVRRAHQRFMKARKWNSEAYERALDDYRFANGDAYNNYQWPDAIYQTRGNRPSLTVNEVRQHNLHIINEAKQNKASVKYRPTGDGATEEAAEIWEGLYRHIANISNAQMAQGVAIAYQVMCGMGYTRVTSDYVDQKSFDQDIYIKAIPNPWTVFIDPDASEPDGSDARFAFIFADKPIDEIRMLYPELKDRLNVSNSVDGEDPGWIREDHVREAEYYEIVEEHDELLGDEDGTTILRSLATKSLVKQWEAQADAAGQEIKRRPVITKKVKWYKIVGDDVVEETDIPGTSIPIVPWYGEITVIDQRVDRKGHTRALIGAQQMLNYNWSASVEYGALQSKSPWIAAAESIEGYETYWGTANSENHAVLTFNARGDDGKDNPPPVRIDPPAAAPVFMEGAAQADQYMMKASGQYQADLGEQGNEKSGKAINERQRQSDRATYHFVDSQALAIRRQGQIVLEWAPMIYDTKRIVKIIGEDGDESHVQVDPQAKEAHKIQAAATIFNPNVGRYEVVSDVGPDYATQRQEAFNAIVQILTQAPQLIDKIGDLLFKVADFPLADEIAERLKPGVPPDVQKVITELQKQLSDRQKQLGEAMQALSEERLKNKAKDASADIDSYKADTDRMKALAPMLPMDPEGLKMVVHQLVQEALANPLNGVLASTAPDLQDESQGQDLPGATGQLPIQVPNIGQEAAQPGGM